MNGKDIFLGLKYVGEDLIEEAEYGAFPASKQKSGGTTHGIRWPLLVAALIAMMLLLVGCAVVYVLSMKEIKLGEQQVTFDVYHEDPNVGDPFAPIGQETRTQQVLTLAGVGQTPAAQAAREWYAFLENYDPDYEIKKSVWGNEPVFPEEYKGYGLYTQDMKDKLDEILQKYDLKLRGKPVEFQTGKLALKALGMEDMLLPDSRVKLSIGRADYYENGNLNLSFEITLPGENGAAPEKTRGDLRYRSKDCLIPDTAVLAQAQWEEWNYTTASGDNVLLVRAEDAASAWIFCDQPETTVSMQLNTIQAMNVEQENGKQVAKFEMLSKAQLEQAADAIDFSLEPKLIDGWETLSDGAVPAGQEINGYKIEPVSAFTDGYGYQVILRVTAPEGVALTDPEDHTAGIKAGAGTYGRAVEDGDGKLNTCHVVISENTHPWEYPEDGSLPYPEGHIIPVYWEDMYYSYFDFEKIQDIETLLTEGTWSFDIPLNEADTRQVELLSQPITAKACTGWKIDGTDVIEESELTSVKLRSMGIVLEKEDPSADFLCFTGKHSRIVMLDGSFQEFASNYENPVDLDQVAYVQLADGTIIPMPGVDEETVQLLSEMLYEEPQGDEIPVYKDGVELLNEPVILKNLAGYASDATGDVEPLYDYFTLRSFVLHSEGAVAQDKRALESSDTEIQVVMKDGTQILLTNSGCGRTVDGVNFSTFASESKIDLSQVDHLLLPDGTKLVMP